MLDMPIELIKNEILSHIYEKLPLNPSNPVIQKEARSLANVSLVSKIFPGIIAEKMIFLKNCYNENKNKAEIIKKNYKTDKDSVAILGSIATNNKDEFCQLLEIYGHLEFKNPRQETPLAYAKRLQKREIIKIIESKC